MREDKALALVEQQFGSLEEFGWQLITEHPEVLDDDYDLIALSQKLGVDAGPLGRILRGSAFRSLMTRLVVANEFTIRDEMEHVKTIKADALNPKRNTDTRIKARQHLAVLEGKPLNNSQTGNSGMVLQINFAQPASPPQVEGDERTIDVEVHRPARAGDLPPAGARRRRAEEPTDGRSTHGVTVGGELDFYSDEGQAAQTPLTGETQAAEDKN